MLNRNLLAALVLAGASSVACAAPASNAGSSDAAAISDRVVEGKEACTTQVEGTARQAAALAACNQYRNPKGTY